MAQTQARSGIRPLLPIIMIFLAVSLAVGFVVVQANSVAAANTYGSPLLPLATPPGCIPGWRIIDSPNTGSTSSELYRVDALSQNNMWAVGMAGNQALTENWNGNAWSIIPTPIFTDTYTSLHGITILTINDVWAVGTRNLTSTSRTQSYILHWDGASWSSIATPPELHNLYSYLYGVSGTSASDVWAVGSVDIDGNYNYRALTLHWNGIIWSVVSNPLASSSALNTVTAIASNDVWAAGAVNGALLMHWDGAQWIVTPFSSTAEIYDISNSSSNDVWAVGFSTSGSIDTSEVLHWDGTTWTRSTSITRIKLLGVVAIAPNDVWVVGGSSGTARTVHWDGAQWNPIYTPNPYMREGFLIDVTALSSNDIWSIGDQFTSSDSSVLTMHYIVNCPNATPTVTTCNTGWTALNSPNSNTQANTLHAVTVVSPSDVWAVGAGGPTNFRPMSEHWDGYAWTLIPMPDPPAGGILRAVSAVSSADIWAVGDIPQTLNQTLTMHWNGNSWAIIPSPNISANQYNHLTGVAAIAANDVWAVNNPGGQEYEALHWNGSAWNTVAVPYGSNLNAITAISTNDIWAVGRNTNGALALHWNGSAWSPVPIPISSGSDQLNGVSAVASNDVWAVGTIANTRASVHWDGISWQVVSIPTSISGDIYAVSAIGANDVWAIGTRYDNSYIQTLTIHWNGSQWNLVPSPNPDASFNDLYGVAAVSPNEVWAVGDQGDLSNGGVFTLVERYVGSCVTTTPSRTPIITDTVVTTATPTRTHLTSSPTAPTTVVATATSTHTQVTSTQVTSTPTATSTFIPTASSTATSGVTGTATATVTPTACALSFADVPTDSPFYAAIRCLACRGIVSGYADGTFRPGNDITRGQIAKIVSNAAGFNEDPGPQLFEDVYSTNTFYTWINRLSGRGFMGGYPCGSLPQEPCVSPTNRPYFRPFANTTRGQLAKIVANAAEVSGTPTDLYYADVPEDNPFCLWIMRLTDAGVMSGYDCGRPGEPCDDQQRPYFRPFANVTRGQASKIVANTFLPDCQTPLH